MSWEKTLAALRAGDLEARDRVVRLVVGALSSFGAYELRDAWDDIVQEVLMAALQQCPRSEDDRGVAAWLRQIALHRYLDQLRKEQGRRRAGNPETAGWRRNVPIDESLLRDERALEQGLEVDLARALEALEPRLHAVVKCKYALGCTDEEGAERLGESLGTYKRLARQALGALREALLERGTKA